MFLGHWPSVFSNCFAFKNLFGGVVLVLLVLMTYRACMWVVSTVYILRSDGFCGLHTTSSLLLLLTC